MPVWYLLVCMDCNVTKHNSLNFTFSRRALNHSGTPNTQAHISVSFKHTTKLTKIARN